MDLLTVRNLTKKYPQFTLDRLCFNLPAGAIMGLIGKNGAGKSTALKSLLNMVHPDSGEIKMFGQNFFQAEAACKQQLGVVLGGTDFYPYKKLRDITQVTKKFYRHWDEAAYQKYMTLFELAENKKVNQLSEGMKVKYAIALALSHQAKLFIFDELTSGLDPVAREELLEIFQSLVADGTRSILFSTHITSDLDKCATHITYIRKGQLVLSAEKDRFIQTFQKENPANTTFEDIMLYSERNVSHESFAV
ncbi:ABC transporter ATP-binding protein [Enterococcus sp. AZ103]|uniref:ABC transporter ATP-binding protein n=1 Tax=Enterococcus sp. AZ103 TaxID=2774628 RepID=UPI003F20E8C4